MLDFSALELNNLKPVYLQLINYIKKQIIIGNVKNGDELPSRREVASQLGINPNTVQKAFKQLETECLITTSNNAKSIIDVSDTQVENIINELKVETTAKYLEYLKSLGLSFKETIDLISELWE